MAPRLFGAASAARAVAGGAGASLGRAVAIADTYRASALGATAASRIGADVAHGKQAEHRSEQDAKNRHGLVSLKFGCCVNRIRIAAEPSLRVHATQGRRDGDNHDANAPAGASALTHQMTHTHSQARPGWERELGSGGCRLTLVAASSATSSGAGAGSIAGNSYREEGSRRDSMSAAWTRSHPQSSHSQADPASSASQPSAGRDSPAACAAQHEGGDSLESAGLAQ